MSKQYFVPTVDAVISIVASVILVVTAGAAIAVLLSSPSLKPAALIQSPVDTP